MGISRKKDFVLNYIKFFYLSFLTIMKNGDSKFIDFIY